MIKTNTTAFGVTLFSSIILLSVTGRFRRKLRFSLRDSYSTSASCGSLQVSDFNDSVSDSDRSTTQPWRSTISINLADETSDCSSCELKVVNNFNEPVLLCWVDEKGNIRSHRRVNDNSIRDGSVSNEYLEYTFVGHSFVCIRECVPLPKSMKDVAFDSFLFVYTLIRGCARHSITLSRHKPLFFFQKQHKVIADLECVDMQSEDDEKLIDTALKAYNTCDVCGFKVHTEEGLEACLPDLMATVRKDLEMVVKLLPRVACEKLQHSTPFWINKTHTYGKVSSPVEGRHMCYHPVGGAVWLEKNGMSLSKEGCIEMYCAADYLGDRHLWGDGGVLLHELSHAFHNKFCPNGFDCAEIKQAFQVAMTAGLYDKVPVHGPQGKGGCLCKHYACMNCMEFWAELSVAYHWKLDNVTEYNKWYPFNNSHLMFLDGHSYAVLDKYWKQFE